MNIIDTLISQIIYSKKKSFLIFMLALFESLNIKIIILILLLNRSFI